MASVFVSHRGSDRERADKLGTELQARGHTVHLDIWDLRIGDSIIAWMTENLESARYVVLCYSSDGITAPWIGREWMSALARQLDGHNVTVLPIRLTGGQPPAILADIKYADLVTDWNTGVSDLLRAII